MQGVQSVKCGCGHKQCEDVHNALHWWKAIPSWRTRLIVPAIGACVSVTAFVAMGVFPPFVIGATINFALAFFLAMSIRREHHGATVIKGLIDRQDEIEIAREAVAALRLQFEANKPKHIVDVVVAKPKPKAKVIN